MLVEKNTMKTETVFSDDKKHRYLLRKEWDVKKSKAMLIMSNPSSADLLTMDYTTLYTLNNLIKLDFGSVDVVNLTSRCTTKLETKDIEEALEDENVQYILKSAERADKIIVAWGKGGSGSKKRNELQRQLLELLRPYENKLCEITDDSGRAGFHPLAPSIRFVWNLTSYKIPEPKSIDKNKVEQTKEDFPPAS